MTSAVEDLDRLLRGAAAADVPAPEPLIHGPRVHGGDALVADVDAEHRQAVGSRGRSSAICWRMNKMWRLLVKVLQHRRRLSWQT